MKKLLLIALFAFGVSPILQAAPKPNILWLYLEDVSGWFSCYGDEVIETPNIDALAKSGIKFTRFYVPAGVCSATRSAVITGLMQTSIGAHNHRSCRAEFRGKPMGEYDKNVLPEGVKTLPEIFREAGYYTFNEGGGKDDFNFEWDKDALYDHWNQKLDFKGAEDGSEWTGRKKDQPFFGQIQLAGGKAKKGVKKVVDRAAVPVPPYYPDIPEVREEIAYHYDCLLHLDTQIGEIMAALKRDKLLRNTYIVLFSDHGYKLHRHKQFLYEGGIQMPLIVSGPNIRKDRVRDDLVSGIDLAPAMLGLADLKIPDAMEGNNFLDHGFITREYVIAARDRCDYSIEKIRAVVTPKFKYLKNYIPERPFMQPSYKDNWEVSKRFREMMAAGEMDETQLIFFGPEKKPEELYDLENDPHEINNLAGNPDYSEELQQHREILEKWIAETGDRGQAPESDIGLLCTLKRWGEKCVNPEYDKVRPLLEKEKSE